MQLLAPQEAKKTSPSLQMQQIQLSDNKKRAGNAGENKDYYSALCLVKGSHWGRIKCGPSTETKAIAGATPKQSRWWLRIFKDYSPEKFGKSGELGIG